MKKNRDARGKRRKRRKEIYIVKKHPRTESYIEGKGGGKEELVFNCICIWCTINGTSVLVLSLFLFLILIVDLRKSLVTGHNSLVLHACLSELPEKLSLGFEQEEPMIYSLDYFCWRKQGEEKCFDSCYQVRPFFFNELGWVKARPYACKN